MAKRHPVQHWGETRRPESDNRVEKSTTIFLAETDDEDPSKKRYFAGTAAGIRFEAKSIAELARTMARSSSFPQGSINYVSGEVRVNGKPIAHTRPYPGGTYELSYLINLEKGKMKDEAAEKRAQTSTWEPTPRPRRYDPYAW
jgi:hypothetical protein